MKKSEKAVMTIEKLQKKVADYAEKQGYKLQPDKEILNAILNGLMRNYDKYGEIYCPCRMMTGDKKKDKESICPCAFHKKEIKEEGHCRCRLFLEK